MSEEHTTPSELTDLFEAACNGTLSESERADLDEALQQSEQARRQFTDYLRLDANLRSFWRSRKALADLMAVVTQKEPAKTSDDDASQPAPHTHPHLQHHDAPHGQQSASADDAVRNVDAFSVLPKIEVKPATLSRRKKRFDSIHWQRQKVGFGTFSAVLTALAWVGFGYFVIATTTPDDSRPDRHGENFNFVARVTGEYQHRWAESTRGIPWRAFLPPGERLELLEGIIEITYYDGAVVVLEGPAQFVIDSRGAGTLEVGKLTAEVSEIARGFTVFAGRATLVDLGTKFGVEVLPSGGAQVHVFEGAVESTLHDARGRVLQHARLTTGHAVRFNSSSSRFDYVDAERSQFAVLPPPHERYAVVPNGTTDITIVGGTATGLTLEDLSGGLGSEFDVVTDFTIVEFDVCDPGGTPGNTVNSTTGGFFSSSTQGLAGHFYHRSDLDNGPNWVDLGGTDIQYRSEVNSGEATLTLTGLDPSKTYDIYWIARGRAAETRTYNADLGAVVASTGFFNVPLENFHVKGIGDTPLPSGDIGLYAVPVGTTSGGSTTQAVSLLATEGEYWLGVGYVAVTDLSASETPDSSQHKGEVGDAIESKQRLTITPPLDGEDS